MEVVSEDGSITRVKPGQTRELGRGHGLNSSDKTISRRHVSFSIPRVTNNQEILVRFEVLGRNPIYVSKDNEVKIFRRFERGEMGNGDMFCVSGKNPVWYTLRRIENGGDSVRQNDSESELAVNLESGFGLKGFEDLQHEAVDISDIDPVKEFGFVVIGHEFDSYPKKMIRDIKNWDWFLEETGKNTEDDEDEGKKGKGSARRKRKKGMENDDDEWTGESEDDKVLIENSRKAQRPKAKYITRSKDDRKPSKDKSKSKSSSGKKNIELDDEDDEDEDEDDETLGGFIVGDENLDEEEEIGDEEEEELADEFEEDEDE
ncbi:hypothetical protein DH2020_038219 [Rehmannia glutinosa]|uniref:Uncharacterized protein n=1 Tax=Rehmannia glutinosa TaxID=99300 RepID=A0ABR0V1K4_REHGL